MQLSRCTWLLLFPQILLADPLVPIIRSCNIPAIPSASQISAPVTYSYKIPDANGNAPSLDFYTPNDPLPGCHTPLVVVIHGGAWANGSSKQTPIVNEARFLTGQGYAVAVLNYSLIGDIGANGPGTNYFPASTRDVLCAVKWLKNKSRKLNFDSQRIAVLGHSAGGHLASMIGVVGADERAFDARFGVDPLCADNQVTAKVQGVAAYYPVTDFFSLDQIASGAADIGVIGSSTANSNNLQVFTSAWNLVKRYLGPAGAGDPMVQKNASPFWNVGKQPLPPFYIVAGASDQVVPLRQTVTFATRLADQGDTVQHYIIGDGNQLSMNHGFYPFDDASTLNVENTTYNMNLTLSQVHSILQPSSCTLLSFLNTVLKP